MLLLCACRQSEALLAIIQAGERVEEVIAERRADIDETTLKVRHALLMPVRFCGQLPCTGNNSWHSALREFSRAPCLMCVALSFGDASEAWTLLLVPQLLERRIGAAQQMEKRPDVVEGLQLLYRRWAGTALQQAAVCVCAQAGGPNHAAVQYSADGDRASNEASAPASAREAMPASRCRARPAPAG